MGHASVRVNQMSVLSGLNLEKIYELLFHWNKRNHPSYPGVCIKRVSIERGSTVPDICTFAFCSSLFFYEHNEVLLKLSLQVVSPAQM